MHLEWKVERLGREKQNGLEYVKQASEWRGRAEDHHSWKIRGKAETGGGGVKGDVLSETKCHENVRARSLPPKRSPSNKTSPRSRCLRAAANSSRGKDLAVISLR